MPRIDRHALVMQPASRMFHLVNEVEAYPRLFSWCEKAALLERGPQSMVARLDLRVAGLRAGFTTKNRWIEPERIDLELVDGPFRRFDGHWTFQPLDEHACKVALCLEFEVAGSFIGNALALGFQGLTDRLVDDFCRIARQEDEAARWAG